MENKNPSQNLQELIIKSQKDLYLAIRQSRRGISTHTHSLNQQVTFMLDNHKEVELMVTQIQVEHAKKQATLLKVHCKTDFKNVLVLAKKLNMKMRDFHKFYTVELSATPNFLAQFNDEIINLDAIPKFFETLDEIKRPIFLNLNHYIVSKISN